MISIQHILHKKNNSTLFRVMLHIVLWIGYYLISYYFNTISLNLFSGTSYSWMEPIASTANLVLFYYPFMYMTWPIFIKEKKYVMGLFITIVQVLLYTVILEIEERQILLYCDECRQILIRIPQDLLGTNQQQLGAGIMSSFLSLGALYILIARLSPVIAIKIALDYAKEKTAAAELEKENLQLEFDLLQSQVNPHFLFNTLNNIHSLIVQQQNQQASNTVARLSGFLRHSLYETGQEYTLLSKEILLLQDYIELEKIRLNNTRVSFRVETDDACFTIAPLLFMPLVENAFKYNADSLPGDSFIDIKSIQEDKMLQFFITNNYDPGKRKPGGGIGLHNLKKRLQHYYAGKHSIDINDNNFVFEIKINIANE